MLVGAAWIESSAFDTAGVVHGPMPLAVHVSVTPGASPAAGVYVVLSDDALANVPVPLVDHMPEPELVELALIATVVSAHVEYGPPAFAVG
jgi:hypothetical protein